MKPQDIEWPQDRTGMSTDLKRAILKAVARANGREDKTSVLIGVLKAGAIYANRRAKYLEDMRKDQE